jgi:hypothetical protein
VSGQGMWSLSWLCWLSEEALNLYAVPASLPGGTGMSSPQHWLASLCLCFAALPPNVVHQSLFMSALSAHPDRSLSVCWEQHCKLLPGVAGISASTVSKWTIEEVRCPSSALSSSFCPPSPSSHPLVEEDSGKALCVWNRMHTISYSTSSCFSLLSTVP